MPTTRISESDHLTLQNLSAQTGKRHQEIIHEALDTYRRERLLDDINAGFGRLKRDKVAWGDTMRERRLMERAGDDGISD